MGWSTREMLKGQVEANYDLKKNTCMKLSKLFKKKENMKLREKSGRGISGNLKGRKMCGFDQNVRNSQAIKKQKIL